MMDKFPKQPAEVMDVDFSFVDWLAARPAATYLSHTVTIDTGATVVSSSHSAGIVKVIVSGGADGTEYKLTCRYTTNGLALVREAECIIKVKET